MISILQNLRPVFIYFLALVGFSFPFGRRITSPLLIGCFIFGLIYFLSNKGEGAKSRGRKLSLPVLYLLLPISYYLVSILGLFYSEDIGQASFELEKKITFIFIPLLFICLHKRLSLLDIDFVIKSFLVGIFSAAIISLTFGFWQSIHMTNDGLFFRTAVNDISFERGDSFLEQVTQGGNYFFGEYISPFINPNYYGMYLGFGILVSIYYASQSKYKYPFLIASLLLLIVLLFCDSKGALISFGISLVISAWIGLRRWRGNWIMVILIVMIAAIFYLSPRTKLMINNLNTTISELNYESTESTALRIIVWKAALKVVRENWIMGVGTGDGEIAMLEKTQSMNLMAYEKKLNAHNQYLETAMTLGILGTLCLSLMLLLPVIDWIRRRDALPVAFVVVIAVNMMFESIFQTFQGAQFFIFFYCILIVNLSHRNEGVVTV